MIDLDSYTYVSLGYSSVTTHMPLELHKRKVASSSTSSGKSSKCTGTKQECEKPTDSTMDVTVAVAVVVPVAVIIIVLSVILFMVYRRSKKEAQEDNDPDFDGDAEFISNGYAMKHNFEGSNDSQHDMKEEFNQAYYQTGRPEENPFNENYNDHTWSVNPFKLPETADAGSLRNFAREIENDKVGGYQLAHIQSRVASSSSLALDQIGRGSFAARNGSAVGMSIHNRSGLDMVGNVTPSRQSETDVASTSSPGEYNNYKESPLQNKGNRENVPLSIESIGIKNDENVVESNYDARTKQKSQNVMNKSVRVQDVKYDDGNDDYAVQLSETEEENIKRMKSIYQVYLDRSGTMKQNAQLEKDADEINFEVENPSTSFSPTPSNGVNDENAVLVNEPSQEVFQSYSEDVTGHTVEQVADTSYQDEGSQNESVESTNHLAPVDNTATRKSHRIASSIYSEAPNLALQEQRQQYQNIQQQLSPQAYNNMPQQYPYQLQGQMPPVPQIPPQHSHPQTLESINELPAPAHLLQSSSTHSLTSFKQPSKQQMQIQTARLNGTALNPVDHPEMFYTPNNNSYGPIPNDNMSYTSNNTIGNGQAPLPYQMRQSIVMTNPADIQMNNTYKPAGSLRNYNLPNSRNNSLTTTGNSYYKQLQKQADARVSGILEPSDVVQPPNAVGIIPHSGSNDDLRRQLGSSHDYNNV
ncbi:hypothetical protein KAFR_0E02090 [Kazachstania africana CBS 2517]|uniref:Suppressor of lethality of kex2 gas1 double null mutant n=1 Tax=Kazachstania africana (strain ATCC 22294 / BCRC 22015 / CBS 2517 / CECT 1963 / NBRC 1671 / NRRL Y-8276) TaxID=1071382 RepID=H2AVG2_KAZAF|nr:hypothetical protein KAFR_0E02090 [Kazachstania africana CBS 2517]CCF58362.1 hypothetical protein KAFR_0E02090 [Kazachstania africana CBS 2517]